MKTTVYKMNMKSWWDLQFCRCWFSKMLHFWMKLNVFAKYTLQFNISLTINYTTFIRVIIFNLKMKRYCIIHFFLKDHKRCIIYCTIILNECKIIKFVCFSNQHILVVHIWGRGGGLSSVPYCSYTYMYWELMLNL